MFFSLEKQDAFHFLKQGCMLSLEVVNENKSKCVL